MVLHLQRDCWWTMSPSRRSSSVHFYFPSCSWEPHPAQLNLTWQEHCGRSEVSLPLNQSRGLMTIFWELVENRQTEIQVKPKPKRKDTGMHDGWGVYDGVRPALSCCFSSTNKQFWSFFLSSRQPNINSSENIHVRSSHHFSICQDNYKHAEMWQVEEEENKDEGQQQQQ